MSIQRSEQFTQQVINNYICNYGIIPSDRAGSNGCDAINIFKISEDQYGIYLLDVAGNGPLSLTAVKQVEESITTLVFSAQQQLFIADPAALMQQLNVVVHAKKLGKYLTMLYGVLDLANNRFNYSLAGHYPTPILLDHNQYSKYLVGNGFPLGILANSKFENFSVPLLIDNTIILFSDGIMKFFMPQADMELRSEYLLNLISTTQANLDFLLKKLNLNKNSENQNIPQNVIDDIIIAIIKRTS